MAAPPTALVFRGGLLNRCWEGVIGELGVIGFDLANRVFRVHGSDEAGRAVLRKRLRRAKLLEVFGQQPRPWGQAEITGVA